MDVQLVLELLGHSLGTETNVLRTLAMLDMQVQPSVDAHLVLELLGHQLELMNHVLRSPALVDILVLLGLVLALLDMKVLLK